MHYFLFKGDSLYCEKVKVQQLASCFGTPLYIYSQRTMLEHYTKLKKAFACIDPLICYSVKVNSNIALMKLLVDAGAGLDIVSGGELYRAAKVRCPAKKIVYASVGKTDEEIKEALRYGILMFNVESLPELERINALAKASGLRCDVALRLNPGVSANTHAYITTGRKENKFGMDETTIKDIILKRRRYPAVNIIGIHMHIGSQITQSAPYEQALHKASKLIILLKKQGIQLSYLNIGGGLGIIYEKEKPQTADAFAKKIIPLLKPLHMKVILEPGRFIIGNAGILVTKVLYIKETAVKRFIIVDAAMNDLLRPSLYGAYHHIEPVQKSAKVSKKLADVVGPVCESADFLGKNRKLAVKAGDYLAVFSSGAYGFSMSSNYNSRCRAAEVLVNGAQFRCIGRRETYKDLVQREIF